MEVRDIEILQKNTTQMSSITYRIDLTKLVVDSIAPSKIVPADIGLNESASPTIELGKKKPATGQCLFSE